MNINDIVAAYIAAKEEENTAKKRADALRAAILEHAGKDSAFETDDYIVTIKTTISTILDTKALYKDFPDMKEVYGRPSAKTSVIPTEKPESMRKTA